MVCELRGVWVTGTHGGSQGGSCDLQNPAARSVYRRRRLVEQMDNQELRGWTGSSEFISAPTAKAHRFLHLFPRRDFHMSDSFMVIFPLRFSLENPAL